MEAVLVPITVALIGGPLMWLLRRADRNNTEQHDRNMDALQKIGESVDKVGAKVDRLDERLDDHVAWHAHRDRNSA
jgi:hypothetical protein